MFTKLFETYEIEEKPNEPNYHKHLRNIGIEWSCRVNLEQCLQSTRKKTQEFLFEGVSLSVDHESVILCHGLMTATREDFELMWLLHDNTKDLGRKKLYLKVIGCIESEEILMEFLMRIFQWKNEWQEILRAAYSYHKIGLRVTLDFLERNYDDIIGL